jgi:hypothetical protein
MQGVDFDQENFFTDYKDTPAGPRPMKFTVKRDGQLYLEAELSDYKPMEKLEDKVFDK